MKNMIVCLTKINKQKEIYQGVGKGKGKGPVACKGPVAVGAVIVRDSLYLGLGI